MANILIKSKAAMENFDNIWERLCAVQQLRSDLHQSLLKHGYERPLTPEFVNDLILNNFDPMEKSCREALRIVLECRKMIAETAAKKEN